MPAAHLIAAVIGLLTGAAPASAGGKPATETHTSFTIASPAFSDHSRIPVRFTCQGEDISPPLIISQPPAGARSLALIITDPDAPDPQAPTIIWTHWLLYNLPPDLGRLPAGLSELPSGARSGINDWQRRGYGGPCPPRGRHRYIFTLYALDSRLPDPGTPDRAALTAAMQGHVIAETTLTGIYRRQ
jgi:hypothetical protein